MSHFYFPAHGVVLLHGSETGRAITVTHHNHPINLGLVFTFRPDTERYDFSSHEAAQKALTGPVPVIAFVMGGGDRYFWCFSDEPSRDAELRALTGHLVNRGS